MRSAILTPVALLAGLSIAAKCPDYLDYATQKHEPLSNGTHQLSYMRPAPACRTFNSSEVEDAVSHTRDAIADPDLARLFENAYPNTLDTAIRWRGTSADDDEEELTFVITGDIDAMWLRDSANQLQSYLPLLKPDPSRSGLASLYRGVINLQARYLLTSPYCNSFQPPVESGIPPAANGAAADDAVTPPYANATVFECKYELDSLAAFLALSADYFAATSDAAFFGRFRWLDAVRAALAVARAMTAPTYAPADGRVLASPYTFARRTTRATETLANDGAGSPIAAGTGLVRSAFRPSDDATLYQFLVPANMMFAQGLGAAAGIVDALGAAAPGGLAAEMTAFAGAVREGVEKHGVVAGAGADVVGGSGSGGSGGSSVYAYEVDGFGGHIVMDDANVPSLLSAPLLGFVVADDATYRNTRAAVLDERGVNGNPYFMRGPVINAVGGPHAGPGRAWPMASIVRILTSDDEAEITATLREIVASTDGLGLIHESINTFNQSDWTRQWFSWANGLFGQMILDLADRKPEILKQSFQ